MRLLSRSSQLAVLGVLTLTLAGCFSSGAFLSGNVTDVQLREDNYEIVATDVSGTSSAGYLLGVSSGSGLNLSTIAVARVQGDGALYEAALAELWANVQAEYGTVEGRSLALTNVRYDVSALNLLVYTRPVVTVRADVIQFQD